MDDIDYEKAYKEALDRARLLKDHPEKVVTENHESIHASEFIFPELKEKEDELTWLINYITEEAYCLSIDIRDDVDRETLKNLQRSLIWLKKQAEVKPVEWSEEDEEIVEALDDYTKNLDIFFSKIKVGDKDILSVEFREKVQHWLKSLKDRVQSRSKQEWTEEDDNGLGDALWAVKQARTIAKNENEMGGLWYAERWLNTIKERVG